MSVIFTCQVHQSILCLTINTTITVWKFHDFSITEILREINDALINEDLEETKDVKTSDDFEETIANRVCKIPIYFQYRYSVFVGIEFSIPVLIPVSIFYL